MISFKNGPAAGVSLALNRAPELLRVVIDADGAVDALDQLSDEAKLQETIHVYHRSGSAVKGIACVRGRGCRSYLSAEYHLYHRQPDDATARDTRLWTAWALAECAGEAAA